MGSERELDRVKWCDSKRRDKFVDKLRTCKSFPNFTSQPFSALAPYLYRLECGRIVAREGFEDMADGESERAQAVHDGLLEACPRAQVPQS